MSVHYDEAYFHIERTGGKKWVDAQGKTQSFGYAYGGAWNYQSILHKLMQLLGTPKNMLDVGSGTGGFAATARTNKIDAEALDFSEFAVKNAAMPNLVKQWDLSETPWPVETGFTWVTMIDLLEHIFHVDAEKIVSEAKRLSNGFIVAKICTAQGNHEVWAAPKASYEEVMKQAKREEKMWLAISGHVNSQYPEYWRNMFQDENWNIRDDLSRQFVNDLSLPEDWRTTLIVERTVLDAPPLPSVFTGEYYDQNYFAELTGKPYRLPSGYVTHWGYRNPDGEWLGAKDVATAWKTLFEPRNMLDVCAGRGVFLAYMRDLDVEAVGFDYSSYAVGKGRYKRCKPEWLTKWDVTNIPWPYEDQQFDLVICLDALEHFYEEDLPKIIMELLRVTGHWLFLQVATTKNRKEVYVLHKGEPVPQELETHVVAGHVNVQLPEYWYDQFDSELFLPRRDLVEWFQTLVGKETIVNWTENLIQIYERV